MVKTKETTRKGTIKRTNEDAQCTSKKTKKDYAARTKFFVVSSTTKGGRSKAHITIRRYPGRNNVSWPKKEERLMAASWTESGRREGWWVRAAATL